MPEAASHKVYWTKRIGRERKMGLLCFHRIFLVCQSAQPWLLPLHIQWPFHQHQYSSYRKALAHGLVIWWGERANHENNSIYMQNIYLHLHNFYIQNRFVLSKQVIFLKIATHTKQKGKFTCKHQLLLVHELEDVWISLPLVNPC